MSILRRLLLSITLAIIVILAGTLAFSINAAREYLAGQLQTQAEDAAVSLALTLSQQSNQDPTTQELLVSALFDGGHFEHVQLTDPTGKVLVERHIENHVIPVPSWFRTLVPLKANPANHVVSDGWRQIGSVTLVANDSFAWESLWTSSLRMAVLVMIAGIAWALFAFFLVNWIKSKLLREISDQVRAMGKGELAHGPLKPRVKELEGVTDALQEARESLRITAEEHSARIESLTIELNQDPVTGAANRKFFINEFRRALENPAPDALGHLVVFRQRDLMDINRHMHRAMVDQWLKTMYERLAAMLRDSAYPKALLARLNGSDFALLIPDSNTPQAMQLAEQLRTELRDQRIPVGEGGLCRWALALSSFGGGEEAGGILSRLDHALMQAESANDDRVFVASDSGHQARSQGEQAWRTLIETGIAQGRFDLGIDPVVDQRGNVVRHEATLLLHDEKGEIIPASLFIPPSVRLHLVDDCDLEAVRLALEWLRGHEAELVVRAALPSLREEAYVDRLETLLRAEPALAQRLYVEIDAHGLVESYTEVVDLCKRATAMGARIGLRRLAQQFGALTHLGDVPVSYVKLGGSFVTELDQSAGSQSLMRSVIELARGHGIDVCAEDVPNEGTAQILENLGVALMRGPGVVPPTK
jgi:diguanylate cyclase (GGDEF)-like protein